MLTSYTWSYGPGTVSALCAALATGVLVDAFVVRLTIVPATRLLPGKASWWIPRWLDRLLPTIDTKGRSLEDAEFQGGQPALKVPIEVDRPHMMVST